jgi:hypothetical protein
MSLVDLLQALTASRRTARLRVEDGHGAAGEMAIEKGRLVDARLGEEIGKEAFFMISSWTEGRFTVRADDPPAEKTIDAPLEMLLLEICRRRDEASRLA